MRALLSTVAVIVVGLALGWLPQPPATAIARPEILHRLGAHAGQRAALRAASLGHAPGA